MISAYKSKFNPIILFFAKPLKSVNPSILTFLGLIPPLLFYYFMSRGEFIWALISMVGMCFDTLDGAVARLTNRVSKFGGLLDSVIDRVADTLFILGFYFLFSIPLELILVTIFQSLLISYIRARAEVDLAGKKLNVGIIERPERLLIIVIALLLEILFPLKSIAFWIFVILNLLSFVTIIQRLVFAQRLFVEKE